jgi:hypothetical protein
MCKPPTRRNKTRGSRFTKQEEQNKGVKIHKTGGTKQGVRLLKPRGTKQIDHSSQTKRNKMKGKVTFHKQERQLRMWFGFTIRT